MIQRWALCIGLGVGPFKLRVDQGAIEIAEVTSQAEQITIFAAHNLLHLDASAAVLGANLRNRPTLVTMPSQRLDDPSWNALDPWLGLSIGDRLPYQISWHICKFCNSAGKCID